MSFPGGRNNVREWCLQGEIHQTSDVSVTILRYFQVIVSSDLSEEAWVFTEGSTFRRGFRRGTEISGKENARSREERRLKVCVVHQERFACWWVT